MSQPVPPIFVFADDFAVFASARDAERAFEPSTVHVIEAVYDADGAALTVGDGLPGRVRFHASDRPAPPRDEADFQARLCDRLTLLAEARPGLLDERWARDTTHAERVRWCIEKLSDRTRWP